VDTQSVKAIRTHKNQCLENLKKINTSNYEGQTFGQEKEYTAKTLVANITDVLKQVTALTQSHAKFTSSTSLGERNGISSQLSQLNTYLANQNLQQVGIQLDALKPLIRTYELKFSSEKTDAYQSFIRSLSEDSSELAEKTEAVNALVAENDKLLSQLNTKNENLAEKIDTVEESEQKLLQKFLS